MPEIKDITEYEKREYLEYSGKLERVNGLFVGQFVKTRVVGNKVLYEYYSAIWQGRRVFLEKRIEFIDHKADIEITEEIVDSIGDL